jgi:uncharacterized membrane protein
VVVGATVGVVVGATVGVVVGATVGVVVGATVGATGAVEVPDVVGAGSVPPSSLPQATASDNASTPRYT